MIVFDADEQRVERLTTFVSLVLALILQLFAGLLLVSMCREEIFKSPPPLPLMTVNLTPEPATVSPAKTSAPVPVEEVPETEVVQPPKALPIEPPALQKTEKLKKPDPQKKPDISKKAELKSAKSSKKPVEKPASESLEKPSAQPETPKPERQPESQPVPKSEPASLVENLELPLPSQPTEPVSPESAVAALSSAAQVDRNAVSQTEKPVKALSGEEQKAIARYLAQVRRSLDRSRVYPPEARKQRIEGVVLAKFRISEEGLVVDAGVSGSAPVVLADAVIKMLAGRRFPPPPTGWQPSAAIEININFNLR